MALASSSTLRLAGTAARSSAPTITSARYASTYTPPSSSEDLRLPLRRPRPASPQFFTGRPTYFEAISTLQQSLKSAQAALRRDHIYPLPNTLPTLQPPRASWISAEHLGTLLRTNIRTNTHRDVLELLNELHTLRHVADLSGRHELVSSLDNTLRAYERETRDSGKGEKIAGSGVDELGRAYGMGRRKESSARVWMVPTKQPAQAEEGTSESHQSPIPTSEILINHLPLPVHFPRLADRDIILRPLRLTGLIGAFNIFALVRGGGTSGQAGAVSLAVARALANLKEDVTDVLRAGECYSS